MTLPLNVGRWALGVGRLLLLCSLLFTSCANLTPATRAKLGATGSFLAQKAFQIAVTAVVAKAQGPGDATAKGNWLDSLAQGFRTEASISSTEIRQLVEIWTPGDKHHWTRLAQEIADLYASTRHLPEAQRIEAIAQGLNAAAAKARGDSADSLNTQLSSLNFLH